VQGDASGDVTPPVAKTLSASWPASPAMIATNIFTVVRHSSLGWLESEGRSTIAFVWSLAAADCLRDFRFSQPPFLRRAEFVNIWNPDSGADALYSHVAPAWQQVSK